MTPTAPTLPDPPTDAFRLDGRIALVTGGSRGLGREMVRAFARCGADVVIASRKEDGCRELAEEIERETGRRALAVAAHVGRWDECDRLAKTALDHFGRVDVLVNNAGMSPLYPSVTEISEALFDKVIGVNLKGAFRLSALLGQAMADGDGGSIIGVSSIAAERPSPIEVPYGAAKAGLHNLTKSLARTFAPKVRVNCIMPGPFLTDISLAWPKQALEQIAGSTPLGRAGEAREIVGAALYLASDASSYVTGSVLQIDGGFV